MRVTLEGEVEMEVELVEFEGPAVVIAAGAEVEIAAAWTYGAVGDAVIPAVNGAVMLAVFEKVYQSSDPVCRESAAMAVAEVVIAEVKSCSESSSTESGTDWSSC